MPTFLLRYRYSALILFTCVLIACMTSVLYTNKVVRGADRQWCEVLLELSDPNPPPTTERGKAQAEKFTRLSVQKGCRPEQP